MIFLLSMFQCYHCFRRVTLCNRNYSSTSIEVGLSCRVFTNVQHTPNVILSEEKMSESHQLKETLLSILQNVFCFVSHPHIQISLLFLEQIPRSMVESLYWREVASAGVVWGMLCPLRRCSCVLGSGSLFLHTIH